MPRTRTTLRDNGYEYPSFIYISDGNISAKDEDLVTFRTCCAVYTLQQNMPSRMTDYLLLPSRMTQGRFKSS